MTMGEQAPESRFLTLRGLRFHYLDFGGEGLPPLVLVHGTGLHAWTWLTHARLLAGAFRVIAFDHRGHGDSTKEIDDLSWGTMSEDFAEFLRALNLEGASVAGHSMGGATTFLCAARNPGLIGRAVLVDPIILPPVAYTFHPTYDQQPMAKKTIKRRWVWDSPEQMIEAYRVKSPFNSWQPAELEHYVRYGIDPAPEGGVRLKCPPRMEAECYIGGHAFNPWPLIPTCETPSLLIRGAETETRHSIDHPAIARAMPNASFEEIPAATHFLPMDQPQALSRSIETFCRA